MSSATLSCRKLVPGFTKTVFYAFVTATALIVFCLPTFSQDVQGSIRGAVLDQSGGAVAGATVSVLDLARGTTRTLTTDDAGQYLATNLTPGTYTVRAEAKGFKTAEHGVSWCRCRKVSASI